MHTNQSPDLHDSRLDELLRSLYEVISFEDGSAPNWAKMGEIFSQHARITRITPEAVDYMDLASFRNMAEELLEVGAYTGFHEKEIARRVDRFGAVMHVASAFETRISPEAEDFIGRGINSLQLVLEGGGWKILSLCWDDNAAFDASGLTTVEDSHHGAR